MFTISTSVSKMYSLPKSTKLKFHVIQQIMSKENISKWFVAVHLCCHSLYDKLDS